MEEPKLEKNFFFPFLVIAMHHVTIPLQRGKTYSFEVINSFMLSIE